MTTAWKSRLRRVGIPKGVASVARGIPGVGRFARRQPILGLPPGLSEAALDAVLAGDNGRARRYAYTHLSGWKPTGAFRVFVRAGRGAVQTFIYKNEVYYGPDVNPALRGLPLTPGPPEYCVYEGAAGPLLGRIPEVLRCEEVETGRHYTYLLRDLAPDHRLAQGDDDYVRSAGELAELHAVLRETVFERGDVLLNYRDGTAEPFLGYFAGSLRAYAAVTNGGAVGSLLGAWDRVERLYASPEFRDSAAEMTIHGDPNPSNIHIPRAPGGLIRFVDWEWCGRHLAQADLASLLKPASEEGHERAIRRYAEVAGLGSLEDHRRFYHWCRFERGLLDAAFMAILKLRTRGRPRFDLDAKVARAASRAHGSAELLW